MNQSKQKISVLSRLILILASIAIIASIYVPIWSIDLDAPQYPEGLNLKIYADKIGGNVDIINGLNHYIGMKTLHTEDFFEFSILTYIIWAYAILYILAAALGNFKFTKFLLLAFIVFGVVAMVDFWRWEYNYGHNLNPDAAIIVPGMAYQPPLIGFKQLLNFGAFSMPDIGGWCIFASGVLLLAVVIYETLRLRKFKASELKVVALISSVLFLSSCDFKPQAILLNKDNCHYCEMTISDKRFGAELLTEKGRTYKFDDLSCMIRYMKEKKGQKFKGIYVSEYISPNGLLEIEKVFLIKGESIGSPMGGNMAAFLNKDSAAVWQKKLNAVAVDWNTIKPAQ